MLFLAMILADALTDASSKDHEASIVSKNNADHFTPRIFG